MHRAPCSTRHVRMRIGRYRRPCSHPSTSSSTFCAQIAASASASAVTCAPAGSAARRSHAVSEWLGQAPVRFVFAECGPSCWVGEVRSVQVTGNEASARACAGFVLRRPYTGRVRLKPVRSLRLGHVPLRLPAGAHFRPHAAGPSPPCQRRPGWPTSASMCKREPLGLEKARAELHAHAHARNSARIRARRYEMTWVSRSPSSTKVRHLHLEIAS